VWIDLQLGGLASLGGRWKKQDKHFDVLGIIA
jgi:hypothetical protein